MTARATPGVPKPAVTYTAVVGGVLERLRTQRGLNQNALANALGIGQPAYSKLESGESTMTIAQLRIVAAHLGSSPGLILREADMLVSQLQTQGVDIKNEKEISAGAILIGLGILAALLAGSK